MLGLMEVKRGRMDFFPFNETVGGTNAAKYNFGFGTKLEIKFRLTEDGMVREMTRKMCRLSLHFPEMMMYGYLLTENWRWMLAEIMEG